MGEGIEISLPLWPPFFGAYAHVGVFSREIKELSQIYVSQF